MAHGLAEHHGRISILGYVSILMSIQPVTKAIRLPNTPPPRQTPQLQC